MTTELSFQDLIPEVGKEDRRHRVFRGRFFEARKNYWIRYGWPPEVASFLANIAAPIRARSSSDRKTKQEIRKAYSKWSALVGIFQEEGISKARAIRQALEVLIDKNRKYGRSRYNPFTLGSP